MNGSSEWARVLVGKVSPTSWKRFLIGKGYYWLRTDDDVFDDETRESTSAYQTSKSIPATGVLTQETLAVAIDDGLPVPIDDWPTRPDFPPLDYASRVVRFGSFKYIASPTKTSPEAISIDPDWVSRNITYVEVPQLRGVKGTTSSSDGRPPKVAFNSSCVDRFLDLWARWEEEELLDRIETWDGSWVPRFIRGSRSILSNHAWGTAFDVNASWNALGARPAALNSRGCVRELVRVANDCGFYWGGHFGRMDGMHFEVAS